MINGKLTKESLADHLKDDSQVLKDISEILTFATVVFVAPQPLSWAALAALISKTAGACVSAGTRIAQRIGTPNDNKVKITSFERFRILFYLTCQQSYLEAVANDTEFQVLVPASKLLDLKPLRQSLDDQIAALEEANVDFQYGVDPSLGRIPLFDAYSQWLLTLLRATDGGIRASRGEAAIKAVAEKARTRLKHALSSDEPIHNWMRNFLVLSSVDTTLSELGEIRRTLNGWKDPVTIEENRQREAWRSYRDTLKRLPDQKDSMYSEDFGVRKVFVTPQVAYHRAGTESVKNKLPDAPSIWKLLGALASNREEGTDLVILCGGPGSGKSTLCRMIAAELAEDEEIHPVFLRLRRCKEGADISSFIEDALTKLGVISRIAELHTLSNVVLILDGFDELVMASKTRLRHFFNTLQEDVRHGPLRTCKVILSGRDTLFPNGAGLPRGSHVLSLLPFNRSRINKWSAKWRGLHPTGPGSTFKPETRLAKEGSGARTIDQLISWPLTLHLLAKVHTASLYDFSSSVQTDVERAYLYRSIMQETALRQRDQAEGAGRLSPDKMHEFLREIAWFMYSLSKDALGIEDIFPLAKQFFPDKDESALGELTEVAIVNAPELKKGEDTGFEFVHKSFSEYLVAERIARSVEEVCHRTTNPDGQEEWFRDLPAAIRVCASIFGNRCLSAEVQEMLEPMLGAFRMFKRGDSIKDIVSSEARACGLTQIQKRMNELYVDFLGGRSMLNVYEQVRQSPLVTNPMEGYANYGVGIVLIGISAARMILDLDRAPMFNMNTSEGAFWKWALLIHAGGVQLEGDLASRLSRVAVITENSRASAPGDWSIPLKIGHLHNMTNYVPNLSNALEEYFAESRNVLETLIATRIVFNRMTSERSRKDAPRGGRTGEDHLGDHCIQNIVHAQERLMRELQRAGFIGASEAAKPVELAALSKLVKVLDAENAPSDAAHRLYVMIESAYCHRPKGRRGIAGILDMIADQGSIELADKELERRWEEFEAAVPGIDAPPTTSGEVDPFVQTRMKNYKAKKTRQS